MIARMSENIASVFIVHGIIPEDDREVYSYSFQLLLSNLISLIFVVVVAIISGTAILSAFFLIGFVPLRVIAGGYHAKNHFRCFVILVFVYSVFLALLTYTPTIYRVPIIIAGTLMTALLIFLLSPSKDSNKPLSVEQVARLRKSSRLAVVLYAAVIGSLTLILIDTRFVFALSLGVTVVGVSLMANFVKLKFSKLGKTHEQKGGCIMRKFKTWILKFGGLTATCALALGIAFAPAACGIIFHQPKVPQGMSKFIKDRKRSA